MTKFLKTIYGLYYKKIGLITLYMLPIFLLTALSTLLQQSGFISQVIYPWIDSIPGLWGIHQRAVELLADVIGLTLQVFMQTLYCTTALVLIDKLVTGSPISFRAIYQPPLKRIKSISRVTLLFILILMAWTLMTIYVIMMPLLALFGLTSLIGNILVILFLLLTGHFFIIRFSMIYPFIAFTKRKKRFFRSSMQATKPIQWHIVGLVLVTACISTLVFYLLFVLSLPMILNLFITQHLMFPLLIGLYFIYHKHIEQSPNP